MSKKESYLDRFKRLALLEYVSLGNVLGEEGEEPSAPTAPQGGADAGAPMPPQDGPDMGNTPMGDGTQQAPPQGLNPQGVPADVTGTDNTEAPLGDSIDGMAQPQDSTPVEGGNMEDDVEEIDVDDLVDSQEETEKKVAKLMKKFSGAADKMMSAIDSLSAKIDASSERLSNLEAEFEKRNPTPVENLSMRTTNSYPFGQTVDDYWKNKEATSNYVANGDVNKAADPKYTITKNDVDNISDYQNIAKEMNSRKYSLSELLDL